MKNTGKTKPNSNQTGVYKTFNHQQGLPYSAAQINYADLCSLHKSLVKLPIITTVSYTYEKYSQVLDYKSQ